MTNNTPEEQSGETDKADGQQPPAARGSGSRAVVLKAMPRW